MRFAKVTTSEKFTKFLKKQIREGVYKSQDKLPSERVLAEKYNISRLTIHKVLSNMVAEGVLFRNSNKGTYVSESQKVILSVHMTRNPAIDVKKLTQLFKKKHPEVTVKITFFSDHDLKTMSENSNEALDLIRKDKNIDVISLFDNTIDLLLENNILMDISETELFNKNMFQLPGSPFVRDGRRYGIPFIFSPIMIFCNKKLFQERGIPVPTERLDWKQFTEIASKLTVPAKEQYGFAFRSHINRWPVLINKKGGKITDNDGSSLIDSSESCEAFKFFYDYIHSLKISPSPITNVIRLFCDGKVGMLLDCAYTLPQFKQYAKFPLDAIPVPGSREYPTGLLTTGLGVKRDSKRKELALEFIKTALSLKFQENIEQSNCGIPIRRDAIPEDSIKHKFIKELPYSDVMQKSLDCSKIFNLLNYQLPSFWVSMQSPEIVLKRLAEDIYHERSDEIFSLEEVL